MFFVRLGLSCVLCPLSQFTLQQSLHRIYPQFKPHISSQSLTPTLIVSYPNSESYQTARIFIATLDYILLADSMLWNQSNKVKMYVSISKLTSRNRFFSLTSLHLISAPVWVDQCYHKFFMSLTNWTAIGKGAILSKGAILWMIFAKVEVKISRNWIKGKFWSINCADIEFCFSFSKLIFVSNPYYSMHFRSDTNSIFMFLLICRSVNFIFDDRNLFAQNETFVIRLRFLKY